MTLFGQQRSRSTRFLRSSVLWRTSKPRCNDWEALLAEVWGLKLTDSIHLPLSYVRFYQECTRNLDRSVLSFSSRQDVLSVLSAIKELNQFPVSQMKNELEGRQLPWIVGTNQEDAIETGIDFFVQLWLMVDLAADILSEQDLTIKEMIARALPSPTTTGGTLSSNLKEKNLVRIGGMEVIYTSYLNEHLELVEGPKVKVFIHCSLLRRYSQSYEG